MPPSCGQSASIRNVEGGVAGFRSKGFLYATGLGGSKKQRVCGSFGKISPVICAFFGLEENNNLCPCRLGDGESKKWKKKTKQPPGDSIRDT